MYKESILDNGLRVILNHMPHMESASIGIWIGVGSRYEDKNISGISHFLEHIVFKGTSNRSSRKIKEEIEGRGGTLNGFTSEEITCYLARLSSRHAGIAIDVLLDMILNASLKNPDVELERKVIMEEIKMYHDLPTHHIHDLLSETMWPEHPLGLPVSGDIKTVEAITREDILKYKRNHYAPKRIVVVVSGRFDSRCILKKIDAMFRDVNHNGIDSDILPFKSTQSGPKVKILNKDTAQTRLCIGFHSPGRMHKDRFVLALLHVILGANMSSRLFEIVREKRGLAYDIGTEIKKFNDTGAFVINVGLDHSKVIAALKILVKELEKIKHNLVGMDELRRSKEYMTTQLSLMLEDTMEHMLWVGEHAITTGKIPSKREIFRKIESITASDLQRLSREIFRSINTNVALIGPIKDEEKENILEELQNLR